MLMSDKNFSACHAVVPPQAYYDACIHETCLCNKGGDCACYCAAIATYVRACNQHGISITWRREGFCGKCWIEWHLKIILLYDVSVQSTRLVRKQRKIIKLLKYIFSLRYIWKSEWNYDTGRVLRFQEKIEIYLFLLCSYKIQPCT